MKIGFDAKRAFRNFTGLGNYSRAIIRLMSTYFPENEYVLYTPSKQGLYEHHFDKESNISVHTPNAFWNHFPSIWRSYKLADISIDDRLDIFHGLSHELPQHIAKKPLKTVVTMHDLIAWRNPEFFSSIDAKIYQKKQSHACSSADLIIAISEQTKSDLIQIMGIDAKKIRVVYQPCSPIFQQNITDSAINNARVKYHLPEHFILFVGRMEQRKNLISVIRSLPLLPSEIKLVAIGKPSEYSKIIEQEAERLHVKDRLMMIQADFSDFPCIYPCADVFVYPSFFEGFGIPILEAMTCHIPVITSNISSMPEVGGDAALYVQPDDYETIAKHIKTILDEPEFKNSLIQKGIQQIAQFSEKNIAEALWSVYQELLAL